MTPQILQLFANDEVELLHWALLSLEETVARPEFQKWVALCTGLRQQLLGEYKRRQRRGRRDGTSTLHGVDEELLATEQLESIRKWIGLPDGSSVLRGIKEVLPQVATLVNLEMVVRQVLEAGSTSVPAAPLVVAVKHLDQERRRYRKSIGDGQA